MSSISPFFFENSPLEKLATQKHKTYIEASPFPHIIIDNFLPEDIANQILNDFPDPGDIDWIVRPKNHKFQQNKLKNYNEELMGPSMRHILSQFNSSIFICFLERLTGIEGLIPDPHFWGGGMHLIERGGFLKIHVDFNWHERLKLDRRLNLLFFLNKEWKESYGGCLEFWNRDVSRCEKKLPPIFNRCVIFNASSFSYHGHPDPLNCPQNRYRKSLAIYYYANGKQESESSEKHRTTYKLRPGESPFIEKA